MLPATLFLRHSPRGIMVSFLLVMEVARSSSLVTVIQPHYRGSTRSPLLLAPKGQHPLAIVCKLSLYLSSSVIPKRRRGGGTQAMVKGKSCRSTVVDFTHHLQAFARYFDRILDHGLRDCQTWGARTTGRGSVVCSFAVSRLLVTAVHLAVAIRIGLGGEATSECGLVSHIFYDATEKGGEGGHLTGAE